MVAAYHLIWTAYGHWLPNDPRGSSSHKIRCAKIAPLGELHQGRKPIQPAGRDIREFYQAATGVLKYNLLTFDDREIKAIACGFAGIIRKHTYTCYACAIMPDHVHLVIRKHRDKAEEMIERFQNATREAIHNLPQSRFSFEHPVWGGPGWKVFLNSREEMKRTIKYVEQNPVKIGQPVQRWEFVMPYDGWLPGVGAAKPQAEIT